MPPTLKYNILLSFPWLIYVITSKWYRSRCGPPAHSPISDGTAKYRLRHSPSLNDITVYLKPIVTYIIEFELDR